MTKALWPYVFGNTLGEQRVVIDDVSVRILEKPVTPLVEWVDLNVCSIKESATPIEALKQISDIPQGVMLVMGRGRGFGGMITLTPLYRAVAADRTDARVKEFYTPRKSIIDIKLQDTVKSALITFYRHNFKRLLVFDEDETTKLGVLKRSTVMKWLTEQLLLESEIRA